MPRNSRTRRRSDASAAPPAPRSKQGCITCRIRRKRCDEIRDEITDSCQACSRLNIVCLGWGNRRPDWCRDKDQLNAYKLELKKKLCTRAGTRPSAAARAAAAQANADAAGGASSEEESPEESPLSLPGDLPTEPVFVSSPSPVLSRTVDPTLNFFEPVVSQPLVVSDRLLDVAYHVELPREYGDCVRDIIELNKWKRLATQTRSLSFTELARRGRIIEENLTKQIRRATFDSSFMNALGLQSFGSPMPLWSPDLVPDSAFSDIGSSAPTSPAAPLLPGVEQNSTLNTPLLFGYDPQPMFDPLSMAMNSIPTPSTSSAYNSTSSQYEYGALGLSQDFGFLDFNPNSQQCLLPEPPQHAMFPSPSLMHSTSLPVGSPVVDTGVHFTIDNDPLQIHFDACILLLQAVISGPHTRVPEIESCIQRLASKFVSSSSSPLGVEYAFAATVAGSLSDSLDRRSLFQMMIESIESRTFRNVAPVCIQVMQESWSASA